MRERSFHATFVAAVLLVGSASMAVAQDVGVFTDGGAPQAAKLMPGPAVGAGAGPLAADAVRSGLVGGGDTQTGSAVRLDTTGWAPQHPRAPRQTEAAPAAGPTDSADVDPDTATLPAVPAPSKDPLDAATRAAATPAAAVPLPPLNAAIKAALARQAEIRGVGAAERRKEREAVSTYYAAHDYAPAWSENGTPIPAVEPVLARLARAGDDALVLPSPPTKLVTQGTTDEIAASDVALSDAVVAYARQATGSRVDPHLISPLIGARPELADPAEVLDTIAAADAKAGDQLQALNPGDPRYSALRDKLAALRGASADAHVAIPTGPTLKIGMRDPRVPALRERLGVDPATAAPDDDDTYDLTIAEAVSRFQRSAGLPVSGQLTHRTVAALGGPAKPSALEAILAANMEMWRWMPRHLGDDRIEVDVPAYTVTVFHDGEPAATNRVVVGKTETPTPLFSNTMKYLIVNPVWNVPESIIEKEFLPKGDGYMAAHGFDVTYRHGKLVVKQPSGPKNALGRIKFIFPNDYSVYLHDTPSKSLFAASKRAFSHGCVRVDQPFDFAFNVLNDGVPEGGKVLYSQRRLQGMLGDKERYVNLPKPLPIHIEYFTASIDPETGRLIQRADIYGYAHAVAVALGAETSPAQMAERKPRHVAERSTGRTAVVAEDPR